MGRVGGVVDNRVAHSSLVGNWRHQHVNINKAEGFDCVKPAQAIPNLLRHVTALPITLQLASQLRVVNPL